MKALTYHGPHHVKVENVPDPGIEQPDDIILRVTATAICGSDLHLYRGKIPQVKHGDIFGHEFMGEVVETGHDVKNIQKGDRVVIPFVIACGDCFFCRLQQYSACENTNDGHGAAMNKKQIPPPAALFGYSHLYGGVPGGQAEYVRVPKGNVGPFKVPPLLSDDKALFLSDILPTAWQAAKNAQIQQGSSVAVFGAGPVGLLTIACARLLGAEQIFVVDHHAWRLRFAEERYGAIPINFDDENDPAEKIIEQTAGHRGVDAVIDAVGFEAKGSLTETVLTNLKLEGSSGKALRQCIAAVRRGGVVSVPGVYAGFIHGFLFGDAFDKGLTFKMGQTHVHAWLGELLPLIEKGLLKPEEIVTHYMPFEEAARGYEIFEKREEECRKVILVPGATSAQAAQKQATGVINPMQAALSEAGRNERANGKRMRRHPLCKRINAYADGLTQEVARGFRLIFEFQHFEMGGGAARQFPVNGVADAQSQQRRADGRHYRKLGTAIRHIGGVHQRPHACFTIAQIAEFNAAVHGDDIVRHLLWGTHLRAIQFGVERVGNRQIRIRRLFQKTINTFGVKVVNDNSGSGHFLLHVIDTASSAGKWSQKKTLTVWRRGFNSHDDTETYPVFEVI